MGTIIQKVLFLGTSNSSVSIMAEALLNDLGKGQYRAFSAGSVPAGFIHPAAIETLKRHGISPHGLINRSWNAYSTQYFDFVITVCNDIREEIWPVFPGRPKQIHWGIPNLSPYLNEAAADAAFEQAFQALKAQIENLCIKAEQQKPEAAQLQA